MGRWWDYPVKATNGWDIALETPGLDHHIFGVCSKPPREARILASAGNKAVYLWHSLWHDLWYETKEENNYSFTFRTTVDVAKDLEERHYHNNC